ncbi:hypothetical protein DICVIV_02565 [Dictyocaulus viviparus]|uniref:RRM domain-containing protein n=1 Tax=Dictyocaulus viviparus TaxID=29172 RepID=A0A0D8Y3K9_DICVI|nr:hypothetical protein DICVIV_02565 [Dictyocaulus viviparus]
MNDVITRAKAAVLGLRPPSPASRIPQHIVQQEQVPSWEESMQLQTQYVAPLVNEQPTKPSSFAPDPSEFNKPLYTRGPPQQQLSQQHMSQNPVERSQNEEYNAFLPTYSSAESYQTSQHMSSINSRTMSIREDVSHEKHGTSETKVFQHDAAYREEDHYGNSEHRPYDTKPRFFGAPPSRNPSMKHSPSTGMTMSHRAVPTQQHVTDDKHTGAQIREGNQLPMHLKPPYGIPPAQLRGTARSTTPSNRSAEIAEVSNYNSTNHHERYNGPVALQKEDHRKSAGGPRALLHPLEGRSRPNGGHPTVLQNRQQVPPTRSTPSTVNSWRNESRAPPAKGGSLLWDANSQKRELHNGSSTVPPQRKPLIGQAPHTFGNDNNHKPSASSTGLMDSRPVAPPRLAGSVNHAPINRTPLLGPNFGAGPNIPRPASSGPKYVELSRLPTEMLRPSVLEQFLRPSVPLQISSVKVVYSSQGIHMNTLVRFESASDAESVISRDGELGIRVRPSTKVAFDEAIDGLPPTLIASPEAIDTAERKRDLELSRRRSRSRSLERRRSKRETSPRKRQRSESRSRDRRGIRRSRSRSLKRSRQTTSSTRWCLQLTNVPFRCTEAEIIDWLSERVRPSKVTRTFYADGNASDRWIAEFESESLMERAQGIKRLLMGRTVKMCHIDNDQADELMKIEDIYGERRKEDNEKMMNEISHFNPPPVRGRGGGPVFFPAPARGLSSYGRGSLFGPSTIASGTRGRGMKRGFSSFSHESNLRGRGRGAFGRGGIYGKEKKPLVRSASDGVENLDESHNFDVGSPRSPEPEPVAATDDFVASLGPRGTVLSCCGFPSDVTMEDVLSFFRGYPVDHNSVRIRMGDDGIPTGECMLAMKNTETANKAVTSLSGNSLRGQAVSLQLANP